MGPYDKIRYRGFWMNRRTKAMLLWAEDKAGFKFPIVQGSYNKGVGASAGTHDLGGVLDVDDEPMTITQRKKMVHALKDAGFAAWFRPARPGVWGSHVHMVGINDTSAAPLAKEQVKDYLNGRNGLVGHALDKTYRPDPQVVWSWAKGKPVPKR